LFRAVLGVLRLARQALGTAPLGTREVFTPGGAITHSVPVGASLAAKRAAMAAHASQRRASGEVRVLDRLLRLPLPVFALAFGREWFLEQGRPPGGRISDVFATLRGH
jgi:hypothetical protein